MKRKIVNICIKSHGKLLVKICMKPELEILYCFFFYLYLFFCMDSAKTKLSWLDFTPVQLSLEVQ